MYSRYLIICCFIVIITSQVKAQSQDAAILRKVDVLLNKMTLDEKVGQLNQYSGKVMTGPANPKKNDLETEIKNGWVGSVLNVKGARGTREVQDMAMQSRLKIPLLFSLDVIHGYKTTFPIPLAEAASWDLDAIELSAHLAAREAAASGIHWTFAPMVDIARDPRWGRIMEGAGEDPYLGSRIAEARVIGFQGRHLGGTDAVMATAKHFAAYGAATAGRDYTAVEMSDHELWQTYLPPFKAAANVGVATFMNSFNTFNGIPATANSYLLRNILKNKWNYKGFVVSDWNSIGEMLIWGYARDKQDAAFKAITAGSDMDMEGSIYRKNLVTLVKEGKVNIALIDDAVKRILYKKYELGLFDDPYKFCDEAREQQVLNDPQNRVAARAVAEKSIVLLKNENQVLPLTAKVKTIALIGPLVKAKRDQAGAWNVNQDTTEIVSMYDGVLSAVAKNQQLVYAKGGTVQRSSEQDIAEAVSIAAKSDVVIMALGETFDMSGESKSRANIELPGDQQKLFDAIEQTGKPIIVIIMGGRPLIFNKIADKAQAILYTWWLGSEAGNAIADVLFGKYNPAGKLPVSFPRSMGQIPLFYSQTNTGRPYNNEANKLYLSSYIDEQNTPRYEFGYGLSYTTFSYSDLKIDKPVLSTGDSLRVTFKITNTGKYAGEEVAQLYLRDEVASVVQPVKLLKDFSKVMLKPGESKTLVFIVNKEKLSFYNKYMAWVTEPGNFKLMIGSSSDDIRLKGSFELTDGK
ncbi:beta-glucosidase [Mucilaginibacter gracilis]|uniref:Periplasmic beta-glucosidase n=1 Tax=Mucilaginibacter gracilis TaxID=423350 RepID=A0A495J5J4_9SPHI|nr:beta-glucosidase BglX [Mucilaginibacter gracilis]RKR83688.1 beta-glucosidase [Mucilaginibacter gracilis]